MKGKCIFLSFCLVVFLLWPSSLVWTQKAPELSPEEENLKLLYPNTAFKYRGVISGDIASGDAAHELMADFGSMGVWFLGGAGGPWHIKSPDNPDYIIGADLDGDGDLEVVGDFGAKGMWYFDYSPTGGKWTWMTSDSPTRFLAVDDDDDGAQEIHADFATKGLWRFDKTEKWKLLTSDNPNIGLRSDVYMTGWEESVWNFSTAPGTWLVYMSLSKPLWENLTGDRIYDDNASAELGIGDSSEELVCDFASKGLWGTSWESGNQTWTKITSWDPYDIRPVRFVGADDYELIIQFNSTDATGLYMWNCGGSFPGTLTQISTNGLTEANGDEEVAVDFGTKGLWLYDWTYGSWTKLTSDSPRYMVRSDLFGHGVDDVLICDFSAKGLWYYRGDTKTWVRLSPDSPD